MTPEQQRMEGLGWALASRDILVSEEGLVIIRDVIREAEQEGELRGYQKGQAAAVSAFDAAQKHEDAAIREAEAAARADEREKLAVKIEQRVKWLAARRGMFPQSAKLANRQEEAAKCLGMIFRATEQQEAAE